MAANGARQEERAGRIDLRLIEPALAASLRPEARARDFARAEVARGAVDAVGLTRAGQRSPERPPSGKSGGAGLLLGLSAREAPMGVEGAAPGSMD